MFATPSTDDLGLIKSDSMLANELFKGVEGTLERVRSAGSQPGYMPLAIGQMFEFASLDAKAAELYSKAFEDKDQHVALEALARYVITLLKQELHMDALKAAERLARIAPEFKLTSVIRGETYSSMTLLGEALFVNERLEDAERAYKAALKTLPGDPFVSGRLALLYLATSKSKEAVGLMGAASKSSRYSDLVNTLELVKTGVLVANINATSAVTQVIRDVVGRPFRVDEFRTAGLVERGDWN